MTFFFFSSRRRHTRWPRDWSSDVCRQDQVTPAATARDGEPAQRHAEDDDEDYAGPEHGHRQADERDDADEVVDEASRAGSGDDAERDADEDDHGHRCRGELGCGGEGFTDDLADRSAFAHGHAQVALHHINDVVPVADQQRLVQAEVGAQVRDRFGRGELTKYQGSGITGDQVKGKSDDEDYAQKNRDYIEQPSDRIGKHRYG